MSNPVANMFIILGTSLYLLGIYLPNESLIDCGFIIYSALIIYGILLVLNNIVLKPLIWIIKNW